MASKKRRSTRKLCTWMVEQVNSGKYPGLVWDDEAKTMFRIPWKHAGKKGFQSDEDAAIFKAWAQFKGKLADGARDDPTMWKTRLRCALNKSPEFSEVMDRAKLVIDEPYKVYRLVPFSQQGLVVAEKRCMEKPVRRQKKQSSENTVQVKQIKEEPVASQLCVEDILLRSDIITTQIGYPVQQSGMQGEGNFQQLLICKEKVPPEQQKCNPRLDQEDPELPHKEELHTNWTKIQFTPVPVKSEEDVEKPLIPRAPLIPTETAECGDGNVGCFREERRTAVKHQPADDSRAGEASCSAESKGDHAPASGQLDGSETHFSDPDLWPDKMTSDRVKLVHVQRWEVTKYKYLVMK